MCGGHKAQKTIKLLCKKPLGILGAHSAARVCGKSILEAFKAINVKGREREGIIKREDEGKETNTEFGTRHRIFGVWPRSMGSARVDYRMHHADGTPLR